MSIKSENWTNLGGSGIGNATRNQLIELAHEQAQEVAKQMLFSSNDHDAMRNAMALPALKQNLTTQINALGDEALQEELGVSSLENAGPQQMQKLANNLVQDSQKIFGGADAYGQISVFHNTPTIGSPEPVPVDVQGKEYDAPLDRADLQTLYKDSMSYANAFKMNDEQALALFAAASLGGKNLSPMLNDPSKDALRDLFHSIHLEMMKDPRFVQDMVDRFDYDEDGNVLLHLNKPDRDYDYEDDEEYEYEHKSGAQLLSDESEEKDLTSVANPTPQDDAELAEDMQQKHDAARKAKKPDDDDPMMNFMKGKPKPKPGKKEEKEEELENKQEAKQKKTQQPKPKQPGQQVDKAEEALRAIWGGGRIPNHGGQVFLGMGHITKRHEELGNGVTKPLSRDNIEARNDWLHSSSLPNFGNKFNETLQLQKKQQGGQQSGYDISNPLVRSMMEGPLKKKLERDQ